MISRALEYRPDNPKADAEAFVVHLAVITVGHPAVIRIGIPAAPS